jgi:hypothetical protein
LETRSDRFHDPVGEIIGVLIVAFLLVAALAIGGCEARSTVSPPQLHNLVGAVEIRQVCIQWGDGEAYQNALAPVLAAFDAAGYRIASVGKDQFHCVTVVGQKRLPKECEP